MNGVAFSKVVLSGNTGVPYGRRGDTVQSFIANPEAPIGVRAREILGTEIGAFVTHPETGEVTFIPWARVSYAILAPQPQQAKR